MGITLSRKLILASASPRREALLKCMGLVFEIVPSHIDESAAPAESPQDHVLRLSREKAAAVSHVYPEAAVLGADTIVVIDREILGKPRNPAEAVQMLKRLSNCVHEVYTGFTLASHTAGERDYPDCAVPRPFPPYFR